MRPVFSCVCFAIPGRMLRCLADASEDQHKESLHAQARQADQLRGQRATVAGRGGTSASCVRGEKPLHRQVFDAAGQTILPGKLLRDEDDPPTGDKLANQAYENVGLALRFFNEVLRRDSVDGKGLRVDTSVHYGYGFSNAMWTGQQLIVGDGDGHHIQNLASSLGIIAHEFSHGVSQHIVQGGLGVVRMPGQSPKLKGEAGALNESFSDVFASMVKQWHAGRQAEQADWLLGEDVLTDRAGKAIRSLKDPGNRRLTWAQDDQIKDYRQLKQTDDPHKASGIANHAFYLAAVELGGYSWESLAALWYRGYDKLRSKATFLDAAHSTIEAAAALHGKGSKPHKAVKAAWQQVHVL